MRLRSCLAASAQGDELIEVGGQSLAASTTPFQAATLLQRTAAGEAGDGAAAAAPPASKRDAAAGPRSVPVIVRTPGEQPRTLLLEVTDSVKPTPSPVQASASRGPGGGIVGTIRLASFNARAQKDVAAAVKSFQDQGGLERVVLDLRDNRGGLVSEGLEVARLFMEGRS